MAACGALPRASSCRKFRHSPRGFLEMEFRTTTPSLLRRICRARRAKFESAAGSERERILVEQEVEEGEHWQSVGARRNPPGAMPQRMEESARPNGGTKPATRTSVHSPQAPPYLNI